MFTAAQGLSQDILQFGVCRFMSGVGTGAEIVVGIPLLAEAFADKTARAKVLGFMMTGGAFGSLIGGEIYNWFAPFGWRAVFYAGLISAVLLFFVRRNMGEPDYFKQLQAERSEIRQAGAGSDAGKCDLRVGMLQLFSSRHIYATTVGLLFCIGTLLSIWTSQIWLPTVQANMIKASGITGPEAIQSLGWGTKLWGIGGILGYICFGYLADWFGRRADDRLLQCQRHRLGPVPLFGFGELGPLPLCAAGIRLLHLRGILGPRDLAAGAVSNLCARHILVILQRYRPHHHQLWPVGGWPSCGNFRR